MNSGKRSSFSGTGAPLRKQIAVLGTLTLAAICLSACSHSPPVIQSYQKQTFDHLLSRNMQNHNSVIEGQRIRALKYYQSLDDQPGQWLAHLSLANEYLASSDPVKALPHANTGYRLALSLNDSRLLYASAIQVGQITRDNGILEVALRHAGTSLEKAVCLVLLARYDDLAPLLTKLPDHNRSNSRQLGFVYYHLGKEQQNLQQLQVALQYYRVADYAEGVVDTLFVSAKLAEIEHPILARQFADRALLAAGQLIDDSREHAISDWLNQRGSLD